jgi:hypothetical protein
MEKSAAYTLGGTHCALALKDGWKGFFVSLPETMKTPSDS